MSLDDFQKKLDEREAEVRKELETASADEVEVLNRQLVDLESKRANPDKALQEAKERIVKLKTLLERAGNDIGGDRLAKARTALEAGDYSIADEIFAEVEARADLEVQSAARAAFGRGEIAEAEIRWADAASHYSKAARLDSTYDTLIKAGTFLWRAGLYERAIKVQEGLVELSRQTYGEIHEKTSAVMNDLSLSFKSAGDLASAERLLRQALEIGANTFGTDHRNYATSLCHLADFLLVKGDYVAAEQLFRQALEIGAKTIGTDHPDYAKQLSYLATLLQAKGDYNDSESLYHQALDIAANTIGTDHPDYATHLNNLAGLLRAMGDYAAAEPMYCQAVSVSEAALGADHPQSKAVRANLEMFLRDKP